jgi:hypothetical protein
MKTFKITRLHRVQSVRTCSEYTNTRRDKEIRGVTAPDRKFQVTSPFNLHSLLRNYLKLFREDSCVLMHFITFTKCFKIVDGKASLILKTQELSGGGFAPSPRTPYQGFALDPLETLSGPQNPHRLSSPLTQTPGSAPDHDITKIFVES